MGLSFEALRSHLEALAYLCEIIVAEGLFIIHFEAKERCGLFCWAGPALMLVVGTATGIPQGSSLIRFLWYFLLMAWQVLCAVSCIQGDSSTVAAACMAGFATQHIANKVTILFRLIPAARLALVQMPVLGIALEVLVFSAVYGSIYLIFARHVRPGQGSRPLDVLSCTITFLCIGVNRLVVDHAGDNVKYEIAVCIYAIIGCVFALIIQAYISRWEAERSRSLIMQRLLADSEKQYEQWKNNVEQVNIAVHDIKHMLAHAQALAKQKQVELPGLNAIRQMVTDYAAVIHTGNDVLDILLRNMSNLCRQNEITLNCAAYTDKLKSFDGMSLYFLFVNAIDNAVKSTAQMEDPEKRIVDVSIRQFGDSVIINIWNYYTGELKFADGLPITQGNSQIHGFGMKSIRLIVEQFGGVLNVRAEDQIFNLNIMLPLNECEQDRQDIAEAENR